MSLKNYDKALLNRIKKAYDHTIFAPLESALAVSAEFASESIDLDDVNVVKNSPDDLRVALPLIAIDRVDQALDESLNIPNIKFGRQREDSLERGLPVRLNYQIDIIAKNRVDLDSIWRELLFILVSNPVLEVPFVYNNEEFIREFQFQITGTASLTDVEGFQNTGRLYRQSLDLEIPHAYLLFIRDANLINEIPIEIFSKEL